MEATQKIRTWEEEIGQRTPIIAITANTLKTDIDACYAAGMDDYISKPVTIKRLQKIVENWTNQKFRENQS